MAQPAEADYADGQPSTRGGGWAAGRHINAGCSISFPQYGEKESAAAASPCGADGTFRALRISQY
jgi:hypothetical protein